MDNSCKQRAYCLYHSFVIVHTERGHCQASLAEVSVTDRLYTKFPEILGELSMCGVYQALFSTHAQEPGNKLMRILTTNVFTFGFPIGECENMKSQC